MFMCVCISNSMYNSSVQIRTQSLISVLKHTLRSTPDTCKVVSLPVDAVLKLNTWLPPTVASAVWTGGPPEGLPPPHLSDGSGHHWCRCNVRWRNGSQIVSPSLTPPLVGGNILSTLFLVIRLVWESDVWYLEACRVPRSSPIKM